MVKKSYSFNIFEKFALYEVRTFMLLLLVTRPLSRDGGMAGDHGAGQPDKTMEPDKPGNSPGRGSEVVERQRVAKE